MSSPENSVTQQGMNAAATRMESTLNLVNSERDQVNAAVNSLNSSFSGAAATTYRSAMTGWYNNVADINKALGEMISIMRQGAVTVGTTANNAADDAADGAGQINGVMTDGLAGL